MKEKRIFYVNCTAIIKQKYTNCDTAQVRLDQGSEQ